MSYVDEHLLPGERVVYRAHLHWIVFRWCLFLLLLAVLTLIGGRLLPPSATGNDAWKLWVPAVLAALALVVAV